MLHHLFQSRYCEMRSIYASHRNKIFFWALNVLRNALFKSGVPNGNKCPINNSSVVNIFLCSKDCASYLLNIFADSFLWAYKILLSRTCDIKVSLKGCSLAASSIDYEIWPLCFPLLQDGHFTSIYFFYMYWSNLFQHTPSSAAFSSHRPKTV